MEPKFIGKLNERKEKGGLRSLSLFDGLSDLCSNDYLGFAKRGPEHALRGSTGSRLISGNSAEAENAERFLADFFKAESALVFNSGYDANLGLFSSVPQKGDTILYDELIHASVRDGIRLSYANSWSFRHNDLSDLTQKLAKAAGSVFVAVESLYSMDGDLASLSAIADMCDQKGAFLIIDEAHSGGVFGEGGRGLANELALEKRCFARLITFGKAYGSHGAVILGSSQLREYLINFARSFIYTTALPPQHYLHLAGRVAAVAEADEERSLLAKNIGLFRSLLPGMDLCADPRSPIQIVKPGDAKTCVKAAEKLFAKGFAVKAILPPTVAAGSERIRICLHAFNEEKEIRRLTELLLK
jgi:8-amino-7-oxononanoate synthase